MFLTHNRVDFERLHREWLEAGRSHAGIVIAGGVHLGIWLQGWGDCSPDSPLKT